MSAALPLVFGLLAGAVSGARGSAVGAAVEARAHRRRAGVGSCLVQTRASLARSLDRVAFLGRWYRQGDSMRHSWGTGTFVVRFRGSASVGVALQSPALSPVFGSAHYYVCQVDAGDEVRLAHSGSATLTIATGLSLGEHTVRCGRSGEASYGETAFAGVALDSSGELLAAPGPGASELRYEAIGDSITAGFKVTVPASSGAEPATTENEDVFHTYERHLADAWGTSDWHVVAKSGISILPYGGGDEKVMSVEWPCRSFWAPWQGACPAPWDFGAWQADVVTINLGTNDFAFGEAADVTAEAIRRGYAELLALVRAKYPGALILCIQPLQLSCGGGSAKLQGIVDGLQAAVEDARRAGDSMVRYHTTGTVEAPWLDCAMDYSDYTHPTVEGNRKFADELLKTLTADVREFFPGKCGGVGPTCNGATPVPVPTFLPTPAPGPASTAAPKQPTAAPTTTPQPPAATVEPIQQPTAEPSGSGAVCSATAQASLPAGVWAATPEFCAKCADGYRWWPCGTDPALCTCSTGSGTASSAAPTAAPTPQPPTATVEPTQRPTAEPSRSGAACAPTSQESLPAGVWATAPEFCAKCADGYQWWPCDTDPALCDCSA